MATQQFDVFDIVVNVVSGMTAIILAIPYLPAQFLGFQYLELGLVGAGIGVLVLVISYILGEFLFGLTRMNLSKKLYHICEIAIDRFPLIDGLATAPEDDQSFQAFINTTLEDESAPSLNRPFVRDFLSLSEKYYNMIFLEEDDAGDLETQNLTQLYYLARGELAEKNVLSVRFETQASLYLTLWLVFTLDLVWHVLVMLGYWIFPEVIYTSIWYQIVGGTFLPNILFAGGLLAIVVLCVLRRHKYREKQVKRLVYDLYIHLNAQLRAEGS